ncbi:MAG: hypothetical protein OHK0017_07130 [Patescibacteria group bacterium]
MAFSDDLQYRLENMAIYFQGGVRRSVLIFAGVTLVALVPVYFLGKFASGLYAYTYLDTANFIQNPQKKIYDYEIGKTNISELANGEKVLYVAINNKKNIDVGYFPWNYSTVVLDDKDQVIAPKQIFNSYLLPNDNKYIVVTAPSNAAKLQIEEEAGTVKQTYNPNANPLQSNPNIEVFSEKVSVDKQTNTMTVSCTLRNVDRRYVETVDLVYLVRNSQEEIIFAGKGSFNGFATGTDREFSVNNLPLPKDQTPRQVNVLWSVNYLDSNVLKLN